MARYGANWNKAYATCAKELTEAGKKVSAKTAQRLVQEGETYLKDNSASESMPLLTGNLHDSFAVSVFNGGKNVGYRFMERIAEKNQKFHGQVIWGYQTARLIAGRASRWAPTSTVALLTIGVPYTQLVNNQEQHLGFVEQFAEEFYRRMESAVNQAVK